MRRKPDEARSICSDDSAKEARRCRYVCCCTSCAVGDLAAAHEPGDFCCAGNYSGACCLYGWLSALPTLGTAYVLGPFALIFMLPAAGLFRWTFACCVRCQFRSKYEIRGNCCADFLCSYLCESCTISQELRETEIRRALLYDYDQRKCFMRTEIRSAREEAASTITEQPKGIVKPKSQL